MLKIQQVYYNTIDGILKKITNRQVKFKFVLESEIEEKKPIDKEKEEGSVTYRHFGCKAQHNVSLDDFIKLLKDEIESKALPNYEEQQN